MGAVIEQLYQQDSTVCPQKAQQDLFFQRAPKKIRFVNTIKFHFFVYSDKHNGGTERWDKDYLMNLNLICNFS